MIRIVNDAWYIEWSRNSIKIIEGRLILIVVVLLRQRRSELIALISYTSVSSSGSWTLTNWDSGPWQLESHCRAIEDSRITRLFRQHFSPVHHNDHPFFFHATGWICKGPKKVVPLELPDQRLRNSCFQRPTKGVLIIQRILPLPQISPHWVFRPDLLFLRHSQ